MKQIKKVKTMTNQPTFGVVDSLNSTSKTDALSANMGRELNEKIDAIEIYSTEEVVIGKWIDGRPLYRKVVSLGKVSTTETQIPTGIANIREVVDIKGGGTMTAGQFLKWGFKNAGGFCSCYHDLLSNNLRAIVSTRDYNLKQAYAILEYTKTTD